MPIYDVHIYATVRVKRTGIDAPDMEAALKIADETTNLHQLFNRDGGAPGIDHIEYAEEATDYLVDVQGDEEYAQSRAFDGNHQPRAEAEEKVSAG